MPPIQVKRPWFLLVPCVLAVLALRTGWIPFKLAVPGSCAVLLALELPHIPVEARRSVGYVMWAFGMSMVGDWFLSNRSGQRFYFEAGIGGFFLAHLGYLGYALRHGRVHRLMLGVLLVVFVAYYAAELLPAIQGPLLRASVFLYLVISCVVLAAAYGLRLTGLPRALYQLGIGLVVFSDLIISFNEFLGYTRLNGLILPTYYLAHLAVTLSLLLAWQGWGPMRRRVD